MFLKFSPSQFQNNRKQLPSIHDIFSMSGSSESEENKHVFFIVPQNLKTNNFQTVINNTNASISCTNIQGEPAEIGTISAEVHVLNSTQTEGI